MLKIVPILKPLRKISSDLIKLNVLNGLKSRALL